MAKKLLVVDVAALGHELLNAHQVLEAAEFSFRAAETVFPALTCTAQASFRTAWQPARHGMVANGLYLRHLRRTMFWEQSSGLVAGPRIWDDFRRRGRRVGMMFWQQSLGESVDLVLSPAPIHKHHGGMIQDCYSRPAELYGWLCGQLRRKFNLAHYWGPMASWKSGQWIAEATAAVMRNTQLAPDLLLTYLPTLDYDLQRHGPESAQARAAIAALAGQLNLLVQAAEETSYELLVFGDYAIEPVAGPPAYPNRVLAQAGLLATRKVKDMLYPDLHTSRAFAVCDHQIAHVYVSEPADLETAADVLAQMPGVEKVMDRQQQADARLDSPNSGQFVLLAKAGTWFAYPWWTDARQGPDYARHVDIHNKPGYDPCELFFGWPPTTVSQNAARIRGSHGRAGPGRPVAWAATIPLPAPPTLVDLAFAVEGWLSG